LAINYQDIPYQDLLDKLEIEYGYNLKDLFQVMFVITDSINDFVNLQGIDSEHKNITGGTQINITSTDLRIHLIKKMDNQIEGSLIGKENIFGYEDLNQIWTNYINLLRLIVE